MSDYYSIAFAATAFFCYFLGRLTGYNSGFNVGKKAMKKAVLEDMKKYPTKWRFHLNKLDKS